MTPEQKAAYINAQSACATVEAAAMQAENATALRVGALPPHSGSAFSDLLVKYGVHHNAVIAFFHGY